ncbi:MAG TPA: hypothetical protein VFG81_12025 [Anaerolineales bacterium]|jgi:hypothetical protein|nr:hypothetical protein [Anaerolineales bacterium]
MSSTDLPEKIKRGRKAALEVIPLLMRKFASPDRKVHAATILSAAAWLTGMSLYQAFDTRAETPPGTPVKSEEINKEWENLMYLFEQYNYGRTDIPVGQFLMAAMLAGDKHKPQVTMLDVLKEFQELYLQIMKKHGFDGLEEARAGIVLCSVLFQHHCQTVKDIGPNVAAGLIAEGILEAAKTIPPR